MRTGGPAWPGWDRSTTTGGSLARSRYFYSSPRALRSRSYTTSAHLSWGLIANHVVAHEWGPGARFFVDLEVWAFGKLKSEASGLCVHVERGFRTAREMRGARDWLRSCVEVTGIRGVVARARAFPGRRS